VKFYPFNIGDYTRRTTHLTLIEDICYRRLLDLYYMTESPIALDLDKVSRLIGMRDHNEVVCCIVCEFFAKTDAGYLHETCEEEIAKYRSKADRARGLADKRWAGQRQDVKSDTISDTMSSTINTNTNTNTSKNKKERVADAPSFLPEVLDTIEFRKAWSDYHEYRRSARIKKLKESSLQRLLNEMATWGHDQAILAINASIRNGWQGVFQPKPSFVGKNKSTPSEFDEAF
jgi:uncharacterized protein YdaU (DUF1376 family)